MKNYFIISILMVLIASVACEDAQEIPFRNFLIPKGEHYSKERGIEFLQKNILEFDAMFDGSSIYDFGDNASQSQKNKLLGFADCNAVHHENSARFAWQWYNGRLEIYAYCYVNNLRVEQFVGVVNPNEINTYRIEISKSKYTFSLNNLDPVEIERGNTCQKGMYYMLWPYFGGEIPAPHDINIFIRINY